MKISNYQRQTAGKTNLIKYLNPSSLIQPKTYKNRSDVSNIHCRSMQELDFNANGVSLSKQNLRSNIHHSSLFSDKESIKGQQQPSKSKSLSKFIAFFQNSNLLNQNQSKKQNKDAKRSNYNGFSYDLKISGNSTCGNNKKILRKKDKQNIHYQTINSQRQLNTINSNKSNLIVKNNENISPNKKNQTQDILLSRMKQVIEEQKRREIKYCQRIDQLQRKNKQLNNQKNQYENELSLLLQKVPQYENKINSYENTINSYENKITQYENKIRQLQKKGYELQYKNRQISSKQNKNLSKQSRQQDMIIKSLKKVINEQLNKIIQLQRVKIENQYLRQKLNHQQNQTISDHNQSDRQYSFQYQLESKKKVSPTSSPRPQYLSSSRPQKQQSFDYGKQNNKRSKHKHQLANDNLNQIQNPTHFKSFFQIQQSPISADDNLKRFFKMSELKNTKSKINSIKKDDKKQETNMIKIIQAQSSFSRQAIEQVNEQNQQVQSHIQRSIKNNKNNKNRKQFVLEQQLRQVQDSILQQVDQYLTKWRNKP